jgi:hypothetical protein
MLRVGNGAWRQKRNINIFLDRFCCGRHAQTALETFPTTRTHDPCPFDFLLPTEKMGAWCNLYRAAVSNTILKLLLDKASGSFFVAKPSRIILHANSGDVKWQMWLFAFMPGAEQHILVALAPRSKVI